MDAQVDRDKLQLKLELLRAGKNWEEIDEGDNSQDAGLLQSYATRIQELESELCQHRESASQTFSFRHCNDISYINGTILSDAELAEQGDSNPEEGDQTREVEEETAQKELEHTLLQDSFDKELQDLNKRLEQKEAEMKTFVKRDNVVLKQHFERKLLELEEEKKRLQKERDALLLEMENLASTTDEQTRRMQDAYQEKVKALESQICELRKKQENQAQLLRQKQQSEEASKRLQEEIHRIKTHKVQLQQKIKQESEQFRHWKASREKELLQLRKEGRRNEYVMHKLQALNQRQKLVLQRKTEEAAMATRRLKELLESRKSSLREGSLTFNGPFSQNNEKVLQQWLEHELEVAMHVHEVRSNYEKQTEARTALAKELAKLREKGDEQDNESFSVTASSLMSPNARQAKINMLETMINASSSTLVAMASQLSEAEERDRAFNGRARWQHLRTMAEAKNLLQYIFSAAAEARCQLWNKEVAMKELKEKMTELTELLRQSEAQRKEMERQQFLRDQVVTKALVTASKGGIADLSMGLPQLGGIGQRELYSNSTHNDLSIAKVNGIPYDLRKAARGLQSYSYSINDEIETEGESDMDIEEDDEGDQSDEDWTEDGERHEGKCRGAGERGRAQKTGNKPLPPRERNSSGESVSILQEQESLGTFSSEVLYENNECKAKSESDRCCSCSQSSCCKTKKCECKAAGSFCGPKCGCKASKCANRESMEVEAESSTVAGASQMEVAEAMETLRMGKAQQQLHDKCESLLGNIVGDARVEDAKVKNRDVSHAEEILVKHGAIVLQNVWKDENLLLRQRQPLSDIGNVKVDGKPKAKQRKKWQKATVQIVPVPSHSSIPDTSNVQPAVLPLDPLSDVTVTRRTVETASAAAVSNALSKSMDESEMHSAIPWKEAISSFKLQQKISPCTSPLRTHNTHAADLAEGVGVSKRFGNGPASPRGPVLGTDEKENV